jgi:CBS domain-containing protein
MTSLRDLPLVEASVAKTATFEDAAALLRSKSVSTIAVVDEHRTVVGLFGESDLLRGLFPGYLESSTTPPSPRTTVRSSRAGPTRFATRRSRSTCTSRS